MVNLHKPVMWWFTDGIGIAQEDQYVCVSSSDDNRIFRLACMKNKPGVSFMMVAGFELLNISSCDQPSFSLLLSQSVEFLVLI